MCFPILAGRRLACVADKSNVLHTAKHCVRQACLNILRAGLMAARVDLAVQLFPGVIAAPLLLGSIAGTGGRFSIDPILAAIGELPGTRGRHP